MPIKTKYSKSYKNFKAFAHVARRVAAREVAKDLASEILELLEDGISPTKKGKFKKEYSQRYIRAIINGNYGGGKTISPVNLKLSGQMYSSLKASWVTGSGCIRVRFSDPIARIHDKGLDGKPVRRLLPNNTERFHIKVQRFMVRRVKDVVAVLAKLASDR